MERAVGMAAHSIGSALIKVLVELYAAVLSHVGGDIDDGCRLIMECFHGEFKSEEEFIYNRIHEVDCMEISEYLVHFIDYQVMA